MTSIREASTKDKTINGQKVVRLFRGAPERKSKRIKNAGVTALSEE